MPKTRSEKEELVASIAERLGRVQSVVFTTVSGYTMDDANDLRAKGKEKGVEVMVTKKTLLMHALKAAGIEVDKDLLSGSILTTFGYEDQVSAPKLMAEFAKGRETIEIAGGINEGIFMEATMVEQLATLPSKEELYAKLVGSLNAPVSGFVNVLAGNLRKFVYALNAIKEAKA